MSKMKRAHPTKQMAPDATVPIGHRRRFLFDTAAVAAAENVKGMLAAHRDPSITLEPYNHPPRGARIAAELEYLLTHADIVASPIREKARSQAVMLREKYAIPRAYRFHPRDHVPPGGTPFDEEFVRVESFSKITIGTGIAETRASGFASFNPNSGVFSAVGYAFGTTADVRSGPIVTMQTNQQKVDVWLTANFLLDYQYQLSAAPNPAFEAGAGASEEISVEIDLLLDIDIRTPSGDELSRTSAKKPIKYAEVQPGSTLPPYLAGTQEIVPGTHLQGGQLAVPVTWDHTFAAPANAVVRVGVIVAPFVTATGLRHSKNYRYIGNADGRAFGQVTSVHAVLFRD